MSSEARGKSCGLKMFLSQGKRLVAQKPLAAISPFAARLYALPKCSPVWYMMTTRPGFERSYFLISWHYNVFMGPVKALSKVSILWLVCGERQMVST